MPKEAKATITKALGVEPIMIDSALVTAQSRKRLYWTNIPSQGQPEDKGILLKDIIVDGYVDRDKSYCIDACYWKGSNKGKSYFEKGRRQIVFKGCAKRTREKVKKLEVRKDGKANCLTSAQTDSMLFKAPIKLGHMGQDKRQDRIYSIAGKAVTLCGEGGGQGAKTGLYYTEDGIRKLLPIECERLQGFPDGYCTDKGVSNTQIYRGLGNGFTVPAIAHQLKGMEINNAQ